MSPEQANQDVDGVTVARLADAVRAGDIPRVHAVLEARPDLVHMDMASNNEHRALHYAVLARAPEMVQLLMARGADARQGIYPHRDATTAFTIASDRGYAEIVAIIEAEEQRRREPTAAGPALAPRLESVDGPLTTAVKRNQPDVLRQLLDRGLDPNEPTRVPGLEAAEFSSGMPLWHCAATGNAAAARSEPQRGSVRERHARLRGLRPRPARANDDRSAAAARRCGHAGNGGTVSRAGTGEADAVGRG